MSADVIDFAGLRRADGLRASDRVKARAFLRDFGAELVGCPTATREAGAIPPSRNGAPLKPDELRKLRTMMIQFEAIKHGCPMARFHLEKD